MKTIKKVLALLLTVMMMATMMAPAFADEIFHDGVINPGTKGSITINKFENKKHKVMKDDKEVEEIVKTPLPGVTFEAYQIASIKTQNVNGEVSLVAEPTDEMKALYASAHNEAKLTITTATTYADLKTAIELHFADKINHPLTLSASGTTQLVTDGEGTTNAQAVLSNLAVGVYLIVEKDAPSQIVEKSANFLVSIPMAAKNEKGEVTGWNYDIVADPKNESVYAGAVVLKKEGNDSNTVLEGVRFKFQMWDTKENKWVKVADKDEIYKTEEDGEIKIENLAPGKYRFTEIDRGHSGSTDLNTQYIIDKTKDYEFTVNQDGTFTCTYANAVNVKGLEIIVNNYVPDLEKKVAERGNADENTRWGELADYNVGDTIPYKITVTIPANFSKLHTFKVTDTPRFQTDDVNSVEIAGLTKGTNYTVEKKSDGGFIVHFVPSTMTQFDEAGGEVIIKYNATLLDTAIPTYRADNTAALIYSNEIVPEGYKDPTKPENPDNPDEPDEPYVPTTGKIQDDCAVYTFGINVAKYLQSKDGKNPAAGGVEFQLYNADPRTGAEPLKFYDKNDSLYYYDGGNGDVDILTVNSDGALNVRGLANGTYYLMETKTQDGYNLLSEPIVVELKLVYKETWIHDGYAGTDNSGEAKWTVIKHEVADLTTKFSDSTASGTKLGVVELDVVNKAGFTLPTSGGMGTTMFYMAGFAMIAFGALMLMGKLKKAEN